MFNLKDLGDMTKIASQAKDMQASQDKKQQEQIELLKRISNTLLGILSELKEQSNNKSDKKNE